ncbi:MAG: Zn-ribbon domain-containing OB-fold protein [Candidatus Lokiarchaeia archaeon]
MKKEEELMKIPGRWNIKYEYAAGRTATRFFREIRDNKRIMGIRCPSCGRVMVPPRDFCERCYVTASEWVECKPEGVLESFTIVAEQFEGLPEPPYVIAYVKLDGSDTAMVNFLEGVDLSNIQEAAKKLNLGSRVKVIFKDERRGGINDFVYKLEGE